MSLLEDQISVLENSFNSLQNSIDTKQAEIKIVDAQLKSINEVYAPLASSGDPDIAKQASEQITINQTQANALNKADKAFIDSALAQQQKIKDQLMQLKQQQTNANNDSNYQKITISEPKKFTATYHPWEQNDDDEQKQTSLAPLAIAGVALLVLGVFG